MANDSNAGDREQDRLDSNPREHEQDPRDKSDGSGPSSDREDGPANQSHASDRNPAGSVGTDRFMFTLSKPSPVLERQNPDSTYIRCLQNPDTGNLRCGPFLEPAEIVALLKTGRAIWDWSVIAGKTEVGEAELEPLETAREVIDALEDSKEAIEAWQEVRDGEPVRPLPIVGPRCRLSGDQRSFKQGGAPWPPYFK